MDLKSKLENLDKKNVFGSIQSLPDQISQTISDCALINFPERIRDCQLLAISGMGGSIYSYFVLKSLFKESLTKPLIKVNDYSLPKFINEQTFFIGSSYSGGTEETLKTTIDALSFTKNVTAITTGGKLSDLMAENKLPFYKIDPKFNPSGQPRVGVGYMIFGPILILKQLGFLKVDIDDLNSGVSNLKKNDAQIQSYAQGLIDKIKDKILIFVSSEHLEGNIHIVRNQINETAKVFSDYHLIPELNHHLIEGLKFPKDKNMHFIFFNSPHFNSQNLKRINITKEVLAKQNLEFSEISFEADSKIEEFIYFLQFGSYLSLFLGLSYHQDPSLIPYVDYFKKRLSE